MASITTKSKVFFAKIASWLLIVVLLAAGLWMFVCVLTLFSLLEYFTVGHFIIAGVVACIAGQWLSDLTAWQRTAVEI